MTKQTANTAKQWQTYDKTNGKYMTKQEANATNGRTHGKIKGKKE